MSSNTVRTAVARIPTIFELIASYALAVGVWIPVILFELGTISRFDLVVKIIALFYISTSFPFYFIVLMYFRHSRKLC